MGENVSQFLRAFSSDQSWEESGPYSQHFIAYESAKYARALH
jgi:hypothetical protein